MESIGLDIELKDDQWSFTGVSHDRSVARAMVIDEAGVFYFMRVPRDDIFGCVTVMETAGGGVEEGETPEEAVLREVREELGAQVEVLCKVGVVSDYYNLIQRHNVNHYFLCRVKAFGERQLTQAEREDFHLEVMRVSYDEAMTHYQQQRESALGKLICARELPVLEAAHEWLQ